MEITLQDDNIFIANQPIDFRKSINGLCALVVAQQQHPGQGTYIFYNQAMNRLKILGWHRSGFVVVYKKLETGKFFVRVDVEQLQINADQLNHLLAGVDWQLLSPQKCPINTYF